MGDLTRHFGGKGRSQCEPVPEAMTTFTVAPIILELFKENYIFMFDKYIVKYGCIGVRLIIHYNTPISLRVFQIK